jgi:hypothetical protein
MAEMKPRSRQTADRPTSTKVKTSVLEVVPLLMMKTKSEARSGTRNTINPKVDCAFCSR